MLGIHIEDDRLSHQLAKIHLVTVQQDDVAVLVLHLSGEQRVQREYFFLFKWLPAPIAAQGQSGDGLAFQKQSIGNVPNTPFDTDGRGERRLPIELQAGKIHLKFKGHRRSGNVNDVFQV